MFFATERLALRRFEPADLAPLAAICNDPEVMRYVGEGTVLTVAQVTEWIERSRENIARFNTGTGAVILRSSGRLIGWAGLVRPASLPPELIYGFAMQHWGQGFASELVPALLRWLTGAGGLRQIDATVDPANAASVHLLLRHGFSRIDGDAPDSHRYRFHAGGEMR